MTPRAIHGIELRYVLTVYLWQHGRATVAELIDALTYYNFGVAPPASKSISDALRWEMAHGRVQRLRRGLYAPGDIPRSTEHRILNRVLDLRAEADILAGRNLDKWFDAFPESPPLWSDINE